MTSRETHSQITTWYFLTSVVIACASLTAISGAQNPVPLINQPLIPDTKLPASTGFTLTVNGTGFVTGAVLKWNGSQRKTTLVSTSQLKAAIPASDIATPRTASITVVNPGPGGGTSNVAFFEVTPSGTSIVLKSPTGFGVGSGPDELVVGDFNGDGRLDLAVSNYGTNNVSVLLGNGDGTFQTAVNYDVGQTEYGGIAAGDFNGDGKLDLSVSDYGSNEVSVLLGNGDGTFQAAVKYGVGTNPTGIAVGDANGDGKLDLMILNQNCTNGGPPCGAGTVSVLLGRGDGTFQPQVDYAAGSNPNSVTVGDFNGDGNLDLAVANGNSVTASTVSILLGNGDGTFQPPRSYTLAVNAATIATADLNGDGKLDLALVDNIGALWILLGNGDGTFQTPYSYATDSFPIGLGIADFRGSGKLDLAVGSSGANTLQIFLGNGDGTFQSPLRFDAGSFPQGIAVGDFNRIGRLSVAVTDKLANKVSIVSQAPTISLSTASLTFPDQFVGTSSTALTVTLTNGGLPLTIRSIAVTGVNASDFSQTNTCGSGLPAGRTCIISVGFGPTEAGPRAASVTITDDAVGSPRSIVLSGTGIVTGPNSTLSATSLTFATQLLHTTSQAQTVTLNDYGTQELSITSFKLTGGDSGDFTQTNTCGSSVAAGKSCTINITFTPKAINNSTASLSITDNAAGSPQTVSLSGTGTEVKLNPSKLSFSCLIPKHGTSCSAPSQTTVLTNTATTTLSITSIKTTGSTDFSQTNNCGARVGVGASCTITVHFGASSTGSFSGVVAVVDDGGGSPQRVALSGIATKEHGADTLAIRSVLAAHPMTAAPTPTGSSPIGTRVVDLRDSMRVDPYLADGTERELLVRLWYPASTTQGCEQAEYTSRATWSYFSQLAGVRLPEVKTTSCLDAPIAEGKHPIVVFTHGYTGTFTDYTFIVEDLASRGYVVASVDHTYEATAVEFPDKRFARSMLGSHLDDTWRIDKPTLDAAVSVRLGDLKFVVDELKRLNADSVSPFAGKLDMMRLAVAGHSLGGMTALPAFLQDARFKASVLIDGWPDTLTTPTQTPVLMLAAGHTQWTEGECNLWNNLRGPRLAVNLPGAEHVTPTDLLWLANGGVKTGPMGSDKTIAAVRDYIAAFLDASLRGQRLDPVLSRLSSEYHDVVVTTKQQALCRQP